MQINKQRSKTLPRSFYLRPTARVARDLLGKYLVRHIGKRMVIARIVETEAYCQNDPASHAFRGQTKRNEVMFHEGGQLYVYFTYGMHYCANVVTRRAGVGEAVLLRAIEPIDGIDVVRKNRKTFLETYRKNRSHRSQKPDHIPPGLTNGPAKLCQALGIARRENGIDLLGDEIYLLDAPRLRASAIEMSTRIGIRNGKESLWRFFIKGNAWVSR